MLLEFFFIFALVIVGGAYVLDKVLAFRERRGNLLREATEPLAALPSAMHDEVIMAEAQAEVERFMKELNEGPKK